MNETKIYFIYSTNGKIKNTIEVSIWYTNEITPEAAKAKVPVISNYIYIKLYTVLYNVYRPILWMANAGICYSMC